MAFPVPLASVLTGASVGQLYHWRSTGLLRPEASDARPLQYSFRDLLALRAVVALREDTSLQRIRKAFHSMAALDFTEHPSRYDLVRVGDTIVLRDTYDTAIDLVRDPGQRIVNLGDVLKPFVTGSGENVVDFLAPRDHLRVRQQRLDGLPTIQDTRIRFDTIANLVSDGSVAFAQVKTYYPGVSAAAARDALDLLESLPHHRDDLAAGRRARRPRLRGPGLARGDAHAALSRRSGGGGACLRRPETPCDAVGGHPATRTILFTDTEIRCADLRIREQD